ncbi:hypothetical protein C8J56DRAFT_568688 [Mycena floridula]|nr:hypothetical protein C8J56DRAFT_568688 [Mycena floridula]
MTSTSTIQLRDSVFAPFMQFGELEMKRLAEERDITLVEEQNSTIEATEEEDPKTPSLSAEPRADHVQFIEGTKPARKEPFQRGRSPPSTATVSRFSFRRGRSNSLHSKSSSSSMAGKSDTSSKSTPVSPVRSGYDTDDDYISSTSTTSSKPRRKRFRKRKEPEPSVPDLPQTEIASRSQPELARDLPSLSPTSPAKSPGLTTRAKALFRSRATKGSIESSVSAPTMEADQSTTTTGELTPTTSDPAPQSGQVTPTAKPALSIVIPYIPQTEPKPRERAKRRYVPRPLSLWTSNPRGHSKAINDGRPHSLPPSPFVLTQQGHPISSPLDILSTVNSRSKVVLGRVMTDDEEDEGEEEEGEFYYGSDDDDAYLSDPGTSMPFSSLESAMPLSAYTPFSPVPRKIYPAIQRGRQAPFPISSIRRGKQVPFPVKPIRTESIGETRAVGEETRAKRLELLRKRYHDIKLASPMLQSALKSALMSPELARPPGLSWFGVPATCRISRNE